MHPRDIHAYADHRLATLRSRARRDRLAPFAGRIRMRVAAGLRAWAARIDGCTPRPALARGAA